MTLSSIFRADSRQAGFSFVGMILIIFALSVFTSALFLAIPQSNSGRDSQTTFNRAIVLQAAIKKFKLQHAGALPATLNDLVSASGAPCTVDTTPSSSTYKQLLGWCGPYIDRPLNGAALVYQIDGWGVSFQYNGISLSSCGPDRICGNSDDIQFHDF
jgi:competence protein ComGC